MSKGKRSDRTVRQQVERPSVLADRAEGFLIDLFDRISVPYVVLYVVLLVAFLVTAGTGVSDQVASALFVGVIGMLAAAPAFALVLVSLFAFGAALMRIAGLRALYSANIASCSVRDLSDALTARRPWGGRRAALSAGFDYAEHVAWRVSQKLVAQARLAGLSDAMANEIIDRRSLRWRGSAADVVALFAQTGDSTSRQVTALAYQLSRARGPRMLDRGADDEMVWYADDVFALAAPSGVLLDDDVVDIALSLASGWEGSLEDLFALARSV